MHKHFFRLSLFAIFSMSAQEHSKKISLLFSKRYQDVVYQDRTRNVSVYEIDQISKMSLCQLGRSEVIQTFCFDKQKRLWVSFYEAQAFKIWHKKSGDYLDVQHQLPISSYALYRRSGTCLRKISENRIWRNDLKENRDALVEHKPFHRFAGQIALAFMLGYLHSYISRGFFG